MSSGRPDTRRYDNSARAARARESRGRIVAAARTLFIADGYEPTTLSRIASAAGVSLPTVQKTFGTKAALAKVVYDETLAGDDEPIPMGERPMFQRLEAESDPAEVLRLYAEIAAGLWSRLGEVFPMILGGALSGEPDLVELRRTIAAESRIGARELVDKLISVDGLRPGLDRDDAIDALWWLIQPEQYVMLVGQAGWPLERFVGWFHTTAARLLLPTDNRPHSSRP